MANWTSPRWTEKEIMILESNLEHFGWDIDALNTLSLSFKINRTEGAIIAKAKRMIEERKKQHKWTAQEQIGIFKYYKEGLSTKEIHSKLITFSPDVTIEQLEDELTRLRKEAEKTIRAYAEERGLKVAKTLHLDTIKFFFDNKNTTSDFTRKALHTRIARG